MKRSTISLKSQREEKFESQAFSPIRAANQVSASACATYIKLKREGNLGTCTTSTPTHKKAKASFFLIHRNQKNVHLLI